MPIIEWILIISTLIIGPQFTSVKIVSAKLNDNTVVIYEGFNISMYSQLTIEKIDNFNRALDALMHFSDFEPLAISIGHIGPRNIKHGLPAKYFHRYLFDYYQFDIEKFTKRSYELPFDITWIIMISDFHDFVDRLDDFVVLWRSSKRFVIISIDNKPMTNNRLKTLFKYLWNHQGIIKVLVSSISEKFRYVYRYLPFEKINGDYGIVQRLNLEDKSCEDTATRVESRMKKMRIKCPWDYQRSVFDRGLIFENFHDLNGYPIFVTVFRSLLMEIATDDKNQTVYRKLDANVMKLLEEELNSKFIIKIMDPNKTDDPFEAGIRNFELDDKSEILFTGYFQKIYNGAYRFTTSILEDKLCLVAPSSQPLPKYLMPLLPFTNDLWILLIFYNFIVALLWFAMKHLEKNFIFGRKKEGRKLANFADKLSLMRNNKCGKNDRTDICGEPPEIHRGFMGFFDILILACSPLQGGKSITEKAFLIGTLFFGLVVTGLYQSSLVSRLSKPLYYPQLDTLRDVAESNRTIVTKYANIMRDLPSDDSPEVKKIRKRIEILSHEEKTFDMVANRGMISLSRSSSFKLENLSKYRDPETYKLMLHLVQECPATYFLSYVVKLRSPYLERIDPLLQRMQQAGLIQKWYEDMLRMVKITRTQINIQKSDKRVKLRLSHLTLTFFGLGLGLLISTFVFIGEIYYAAKYRCTNNNNRSTNKICSFSEMDMTAARKRR